MVPQIPLSKVATLCALLQALLLGKNGPDVNSVSEVSFLQHFLVCTVYQSQDVCSIINSFVHP